MPARFVTLCVLASGLPFAGCGDKAEGDKTKEAAKTALEGTWKSACVDYGSYVTELRTVVGSTVTSKFMTYSKAGCADVDHIIDVDVSATFTLVGTKIDTTPSKVTLTPITDAEVVKWKASCSGSTWAKGTATDVTSCVAMKDFAAKYYGLAEIKDDKLYLGKETEALDGSSEAKRPMELNTAKPYIKQ